MLAPIRRHLLRVCLASLLFLAPVTASLSQEASGHLVTYQFDADTHHDAPDICAAADPQFAVAVDAMTDGMLVPGDDWADHMVFDVPPALVGVRLEVRVAEAAAAPNADLMVLAPFCAGDVFTAPNIPFPLPVPPLPSTSEKQVPVANLTAAAWICDSTAWTFRLKQLGGGSPPSTIYVAWTDGSQASVAVSHSSNGTARYEHTGHLDVIPEGAWANMPSGWGGVFDVKSGPCTASDAGAVFGEVPVLGDDVVWFTPVRAGLHVAQVTLGEAQAGPFSVPMTCHFCLGPGVEQAATYSSYSLRVMRAA